MTVPTTVFSVERAASLHVLGADRENVVAVDDGAVRRHREQSVGIAVMRERDVGAGLLQQLDDGLEMGRAAPDVDVRAVWLGVDGEHLGAQLLEGSRRRRARRAVRAVERHLEPREVDALRTDRVDGVLDVALRSVLEHDRRLGRGNLLAAHLLDNRLQLVFERVGQLVAVRVEELDAVVLGRIVACRDDDAAVDVGLAREQGNCRRRDDSRDHGLAAFGADARHERVFEHRAGHAAVASDQHAGADLSHRRPSQRNRQVAVEFRARDATHAVRSKKTRHTTPPNAYLCFFFGKMLEAL